MHYEDFEIRFEPVDTETFAVRVVSSPAGPGLTRVLKSALMGDPESPWNTLRHRAASDRREKGAGGTARELDYADGVGAGELHDTAQEVGQALFEAVFTGQVLELYHLSLQLLADEKDCGLRIKLQFDPSCPSTLELGAMPWELLYQAGRRELPALNRRTPVIRHLDLGTPPRRPPFEPPQRVLLVGPNPACSEPLDLEAERAALEAAAGERTDIEVVTLPNPTPQGLRGALSRSTYHHLHFMGHGSFKASVGEGYLALENLSGGLEEVGSHDFVTLLRDHTTLRLVVLNGCLTAARAAQWTGDPFASVATALMMAEVPAVVGMQLPISDDAARLFSAAFYDHLFSGASVDAALVEARQALRNGRSSTDFPDWAIPVLYSQLPGSPEEPPWPRERLRVRRVLERLSDDRLEEVRRRLATQHDRIVDGGRGVSPGRLERRELADQLINRAAECGESAWLDLQQIALALRSSFAPLNTSFQSWWRHPRNGWLTAGAQLVGLGEGAVNLPNAPEDLRRAALLVWMGPRFRDGQVRARLWLPTLREHAVAGLLLGDPAWKRLLFGLLRSTGDGARAEILQQESLGWRSLAARDLHDLDGQDGWHELVLSRQRRDIELRVDAERPLKGCVAAEVPPGHPGLVRFGGTAVHVCDLLLTVEIPGEKPEPEPDPADRAG